MIHSIPEEEVIEQTENSVCLSVKISAESDYFDGHFPEFKIFPAVAQIDLMAHYAHKYFSLPVSTPRIKRFKFSGMIQPEVEVLFKINFDREKRKVSFEVLDSERGSSYSSGIYYV